MFLIVMISFSLSAKEFLIDKQTDIVGEISYTYAHNGETLIDVGQRLDIGAPQIKEANPLLDEKLPLHLGTKITIPSQFILPNVERKGFVVNLAEQRLYFFPEDSKTVITEPVGIGRRGKWKTPLGLTKITKKVLDPLWHPTADVRLEAAKNGEPIPWEFPAGLNNPLGRHIFRLGWASYLIHSTDQPETVGGLVSAGCIRMLPKGIEYIFDKVSVGTQVNVINEPIKIGWKNKKLYMESHKSLNYAITNNRTTLNPVFLLRNTLEENKTLWVNWSLVKKATLLNEGFPQIIGE